MTTASASKARIAVFVSNRAFALTNSRELLINHFLESGWKVFIAVTEKDAHANRLFELGAAIKTVPFDRGGIRIGRDLASLTTLMQLYRDQRPAFVHHFNAKPIIFGNLAALLDPGIVSVNTITGLGHAFVEGQFIRKLAGLGYRISLSKGVTIFQNSDDMHLFLERGWVKPDRARLVLGAGVDTERFFPSNPGSKEADSQRVLMVARLLWQKGVREYVDAARIVRKQYPNVRFELAGELDPVHPDAIDRQWLEAATSDGTIEYLGFVGDVPDRLRTSTLAVLPSYREGMPRVVLEASASGIPVITTDTAGCREAVLDGETGILIPPRDSAALADAVIQLLSNPAKRRQMGLAGREWVEKQFDIRAVVRQYLAIYREFEIEV